MVTAMAISVNRYGYVKQLEPIANNTNYMIPLPINENVQVTFIEPYSWHYYKINTKDKEHASISFNQLGSRDDSLEIYLAVDYIPLIDIYYQKRIIQKYIGWIMSYSGGSHEVIVAVKNPNEHRGVGYTLHTELVPEKAAPTPVAPTPVTPNPVSPPNNPETVYNTDSTLALLLGIPSIIVSIILMIALIVLLKKIKNLQQRIHQFEQNNQVNNLNNDNVSLMNPYMMPINNDQQHVEEIELGPQNIPPQIENAYPIMYPQIYPQQQLQPIITQQPMQQTSQNQSKQ